MKFQLSYMAVLIIVLKTVNMSYAFNLHVPDEVSNAIKMSYRNSVGKPETDYGKIRKTANEKKELKVPYLRPTVTLPVFKIFESNKENTTLDVAVNSGIGGGLSLVWYKDATNPKNLRSVLKNDGTEVLVFDEKTEVWLSLSPFTILMSKAPEDDSINISWATTIGVFNNTILVGFGYDFGEVVDRSNWFGLLSIGASF